MTIMVYCVLFVAVIRGLDAVLSVSLWPAGQQHSEKGSAETGGLATAKHWTDQPHPGTYGTFREAHQPMATPI